MRLSDPGTAAPRVELTGFAVPGYVDAAVVEHRVALPDGVLEHTLELRKAIAAKIRAVKPTVVLTQDWSVVAPWGLNQADHRVAGMAALDAGYDVKA